MLRCARCQSPTLAPREKSIRSRQHGVATFVALNDIYAGFQLVGVGMKDLQADSLVAGVAVVTVDEGAPDFEVAPIVRCSDRPGRAIGVGAVGFVAGFVGGAVEDDAQFLAAVVGRHPEAAGLETGGFPSAVPHLLHAGIVVIIFFVDACAGAETDKDDGHEGQCCYFFHIFTILKGYIFYFG